MIGQTLEGYRLRKLLGVGGMAEVYLAEEPSLRRDVAVKVLPRLLATDPNYVARFRAEARHVANLSHPNIVPVYTFGEDRGLLYLVMPLLKESLRDRMERDGMLPPKEAGRIAYLIASALHTAHHYGIVHRDVKPENILMDGEGKPMLTDFGIAREIAALREDGAARTLAATGLPVGTPEYMAPEQSNGVNDYRSDIYSLGVILYQMLTGRVPFTAESPVAVSLKHIQTMPMPPREINSDIPESVEAVILKALAKDPNERYQETQELAAAYWKALQLEQSRLRSGGTTLPLNLSAEQVTKSGDVENKNDSDDTVGQVQRLPSAVTRILRDAEKAFVNPPVTPLLFPLAEDSQTSQQFQTFNTKKKRSALQVAVIALLCLLIIASVVPLGMALQAQKPAHLQPNQHTQSATHFNGTALTATASATAQVKLQATLAANARVQVTAGITSPIGAGQVLYAN
ncbi:MAG: serine/threonine-protein kinase, partial [Ktedonobacteraceae bacterium]